MTEDYQTLVLAEYRRLKEAGLLIYDLSTRAKFRTECLRAFNKRYHPGDDDVFAEFFGVDKIGANFDVLLKRSEADDFKAVHNHIAGYNKTDNTDMKNTELLAWLIDFQPRPSTSFYKSLRKESEIAQPGDDVNQVGKESKNDEQTGSRKVEIGELEKIDDSKKTESSDVGDEVQISGTKNPPDIPKDPKQPISIQQILISCCIFLLIGISIYQFRGNKSSGINSLNTLFSSGNEKCMYWAGDHYEPIACNENLSEFATVPINTGKIARFKRIMQPDTLTKNAVGKTWYAKREGKIEFYTDSGDHPTDANKRLLPVTTYILNKYISYHRYLLNLIIWFAGIIIFSLIFGIGSIYLGRKVKKQRIETKKKQVKAVA